MITAFEDLPWFLRKLLEALSVALVHEMQQPSAVTNQTDLVGRLLGLVKLQWNETLVEPSLLLTQSAEGTELSLRSVTHLALPSHVGMDREALQLTGHAGERSRQMKALQQSSEGSSLCMPPWLPLRPPPLLPFLRLAVHLLPSNSSITNTKTLTRLLSSHPGEEPSHSFILELLAITAGASYL